MDKWPFFGGLIALLVALIAAVKKLAEVSQSLMVISTFLMLLSHVLHELGLPIPDLLPFLPSIGGVGN